MADLNGKLFLAAKNGDKEGCIDWLRRGANINAVDNNRYTPTHYAAELGHTEAVLALIDGSGNARAYYGMVAIHFAARGGQTETVKALMDNGIEGDMVDSQDFTPLHTSAEKGHLDTVRALIESEVNIDPIAKKFRNETPLHRAAGGGHTAVVEELVRSGSIINRKDGKGATAMHYAAEGDHFETVKALHASGAEVDARDHNGWTPLHFAGNLGNTRTVNILLDLGADINSKEYIFQHTPLKYASDGGFTDTIIAFVHRGAKTSKQKPQKALKV